MVENVVTVKPSENVRRAAELMNEHEISCLIVVNGEKPIGIVTERDMLNRIIYRSKPPEETTVNEIMTQSLITASPNMRAGDAAKLMIEHNIKKLPVVENQKLVGLVSLTDLLRAEGVIESLNKIRLNGASKRIKNTVSLYFDRLKQHRRKCPLIMKDGFSMGCQDKRCMWWLGDECAVTKLSRNLEPAPMSSIQEDYCVEAEEP
jgi:signal-transduction protein with cAMP-binding, CBS, and nucleotidyltransferase domain